MLKKIILALFLIIVVSILAFVVVVALQPADFSVTRSTTIAAPPSAVFAQVNDFHNWDAWSPWAKLDPAAKNTFEGAPSGQGAMFAWVGNDKVGEGRMTVTESHPPDSLRIKIDFKKPFEATDNVDFSFKPSGDQTVVTWTMSGQKNFVSKAFCLFMSMDKMVGGDFERGLMQLKTVTEAANKK